MKRSRLERAAALAAKRPAECRHEDLDVVVVRRPADPMRRARGLRLLAMLLDRPRAPGENR